MNRVDISREWKLLGAVLDAFNGLESQMTGVICEFIAPRDDAAEFVRQKLLHNSSISFAAKVKLILAISRELHGPKLNRDNFHRLLNIRNALAHGNTASLRRKNVNALRAALLAAPYGEYLVIQTLRGDGSVEEKPRPVAVTEFMALYEKARDQVDAVAAKVRTR